MQQELERRVKVLKHERSQLSYAPKLDTWVFQNILDDMLLDAYRQGQITGLQQALFVMGDTE